MMAAADCIASALEGYACAADRNQSAVFGAIVNSEP